MIGCLVLAACGVRLQERPVPIEVDSPARPTTAVPRPGELAVTIYLVRDERLEPVMRSSQDGSASAALAFLSEGPGADEVRSGLRTALLPQSLIPAAVDDSGVVTVAATRTFTTISGDSQLLATAQLVWTVTEYASIDQVRISVDGNVIDVPTDDGLVSDPVGRDDYLSVAPQQPTRAPRTTAPSGQ